MNLFNVAGRDQTVSVKKSPYCGPRATEFVVEYRRDDGIERHIGRFDESHSSVVAEIFFQAVRDGASRVLQSINDFRIEPAFQNALFRNRLVRVDRQFPLLTDDDVTVWKTLVVGLRRRRKGGGPISLVEESALERFRQKVIGQLLRMDCAPEAMAHHRHGQWEIVFRHLPGTLTEPMANRVLDTLERRCHEPNVVLDTSRRNAAAMLQLPVSGRLYFACSRWAPLSAQAFD